MRGHGIGRKIIGTYRGDSTAGGARMYYTRHSSLHDTDLYSRDCASISICLSQTFSFEAERSRPTLPAQTKPCPDAPNLDLSDGGGGRGWVLHSHHTYQLILCPSVACS